MLIVFFFIFTKEFKKIPVLVRLNASNNRKRCNGRAKRKFSHFPSVTEISIAGASPGQIEVLSIRDYIWCSSVVGYRWKCYKVSCMILVPLNLNKTINKPYAGYSVSKDYCFITWAQCIRCESWRYFNRVCTCLLITLDLFGFVTDRK